MQVLSFWVWILEAYLEIFKIIQFSEKKKEQLGFFTSKYPIEEISLDEIQIKLRYLEPL